MDKREKESIIGLIVSLIAIMEETTDDSTKDRIDEQIHQIMKDLNLTWDDM
ncbi:hypothetical protein [Mammaliicoccus sp. A-M4]|uniref:hypothetical protein n=1 Tax=Mammaliicoccus sp. A-M4 TaxID=2898664 RepID=UPI001EFA54E1|nr:hypothetical protein [Mammaliicoccus sp. A-M4]